MPRNRGESDPQTWKAFGRIIGLDMTRRRADGAVDRRCSDTHRHVVEVLMNGKAGEELARIIAADLDRMNLPTAQLQKFRLAPGLPYSRNKSV